MYNTLRNMKYLTDLRILSTLVLSLLLLRKRMRIDKRLVLLCNAFGAFKRLPFESNQFESMEVYAKLVSTF